MNEFKPFEGKNEFKPFEGKNAGRRPACRAPVGSPRTRFARLGRPGGSERGSRTRQKHRKQASFIPPRRACGLR